MGRKRQGFIKILAEWIENNITLNDILYPSNSIQSYNSALGSSRDAIDSPRLGMEQPDIPLVQLPTRSHITFDEFATNRTMFSGSSSTTMHVLTHNHLDESMTGTDDASGSEGNLAGPLSGLALQKGVQEGGDSPISEKYLHAAGNAESGKLPAAGHSRTRKRSGWRCRQRE